jgi:hypothetical protein
MLKQIIMVVQAKPNTHPGGVHGAFARFEYQSDGTPSPVKNPPIDKAAKFRTKNRISRFIIIKRNVKIEKSRQGNFQEPQAGFQI